MWRVGVLIATVGLALGIGVAEAGEVVETRIPVRFADYEAEEHTVVVQRGDHLWKISARHLSGTDRPVAPYWREVVEVNTPSLRSGDPDLIYPGEIISLP